MTQPTSPLGLGPLPPDAQPSTSKADKRRRTNSPLAVVGAIVFTLAGIALVVAAVIFGVKFVSDQFGDDEGSGATGPRVCSKDGSTCLVLPLGFVGSTLEDGVPAAAKLIAENDSSRTQAFAVPLTQLAASKPLLVGLDRLEALSLGGDLLPTVAVQKIDVATTIADVAATNVQLLEKKGGTVVRDQVELDDRAFERLEVSGLKNDAGAYTEIVYFVAGKDRPWAITFIDNDLGEKTLDRSEDSVKTFTDK